MITRYLSGTGPEALSGKKQVREILVGAGATSPQLGLPTSSLTSSQSDLQQGNWYKLVPRYQFHTFKLVPPESYKSFKIHRLIPGTLDNVVEGVPDL